VKRQPAPAPEREFSLTVTQTELTTVITALEWMSRRQNFLALLATNQGRIAEADARCDRGSEIAALSERLQLIGAKEAL
jgi:hypothetical protein